MSKMSNSSSSSRGSSKKSNSHRERDKSRSRVSESGGSSQCDTPPLVDKDAPSTSQGKYAGISQESINCIAEQINVDISADAASNLAEDLSYKLRQLINNIGVQSAMFNKTAVDTWDVNSNLMLADTSPIVGITMSPFVPFGEEKLCAQGETVLNLTEYAMTTQTYSYFNVPSLTVEWITDDRSLHNNSTISPQLQNYYTKVARAILNLKKKPKDVAVEDLMSNTRIGPIFPNLFNLAVLVLNDDNLKALNVPAKKPLQSNVADMVDALCSNPCSADTNIQQQFQRLFPVMVSNILGNGSLSEKMVAVLKKITRTWPSFVSMGKEILFDYLSQGTKERLTPPMIKCVGALGRQALVDCLGNYLDYLDDCMHAPRKSHLQTGLRESILDASSCLLQSELTTYLEDYVATDYTLYEMLGDSIMPRRTIFPVMLDPEDNPKETKDKRQEEYTYQPVRIRSYKLKLFPPPRKLSNTYHRESVFEPVNYRSDKSKLVQVKVKSFRNIPVKMDTRPNPPQQRGPHRNVNRNYNRVMVAGGLLNRFRYKMIKTYDCPIFAAYVL